MKIQWVDGQEYQGSTEADVVRSIANSSPFGPAITGYSQTLEYMKAVRDRIRELNPQAQVRVGSARTFLQDLTSGGYIKEVAAE